MADLAAGPRVVHRMRPAMGTWFEAWLVGDDAGHLADVAEAVLDEVGRLDGRLSRFDPRSEIARINRRAARGPVLVDRELFALLQDCRRAWRDTGGAFDITATSGPLAQPAGGIMRPSFAHVILDADRQAVRLEHPAVQLDLGGLGKGYALDRAGELLEAHGVTRVLLHGGTSSVLAQGTDARGHPWLVGIRDPWADRDDVEVARLPLQDRALSCSTALAPGRTQSDIIDPSTGQALTRQDGCVVMAPSAVEAEILSTALLGLGRAAVTEFLRSRDGFGLAVAWIEPPGDGPRLSWLRRDDPDMIPAPRP
jgi:thiamine biosynthesis lipoprotein